MAQSGDACVPEDGGRRTSKNTEGEEKVIVCYPFNQQIFWEVLESSGLHLHRLVATNEMTRPKEPAGTNVVEPYVSNRGPSKSFNLVTIMSMSGVLYRR